MSTSWCGFTRRDQIGRQYTFSLDQKTNKVSVNIYFQNEKINSISDEKLHLIVNEKLNQIDFDTLSFTAKKEYFHTIKESKGELFPKDGEPSKVINPNTQTAVLQVIDLTVNISKKH